MNDFFLNAFVSFLQCVPIHGLGFRRGSYKCVCKDGFYFPDLKAKHKYYNGSEIEVEYRKKQYVGVQRLLSHLISINVLQKKNTVIK